MQSLQGREEMDYSNLEHKMVGSQDIVSANHINSYYGNLIPQTDQLPNSKCKMAARQQ